MKELFNKLSNFSQFFREKYLISKGGEVPEPPDMSGPELEKEHTLEERGTGEFKEKKVAEAGVEAKARLAKSKKSLDKFKAGGEAAKKLLEKEKAREKKLFPFEHIEDRTREKIAEAKRREKTISKGPYQRVEKWEASKGKEVEPELPPLVPIQEELDLSVKEGYEDVVQDMLVGRQEKQDLAGTTWEHTLKFFKVLKESGDMDALIERAQALHDAGNVDDIESFEFWVDQYVRDATKEGKYSKAEKRGIRKKMKELVADFAPLPPEREKPIRVAEVEKELTPEEYDKMLAWLDEMAKGAGEEWEGEAPPSAEESTIAEIDELRKELAAEKEERARIAADIEEYDEEW